MAKVKTTESPLYWNGSQWINQVAPPAVLATEEEPEPKKEGEAGPEEEEEKE